MAVEVFKTTIMEESGAQRVRTALSGVFPEYRVHFDLEDCDHILRAAHEHEEIDAENVIRIVEDEGFGCSILEE